jgi:hypothetical protein
MVPMTASPGSGTVLTSFSITWAVQTYSNVAFDVLIKRPGSSSYVTLENGTTSLNTMFVPDAGTGTYSFKARSRFTSASGYVSAYSPVVSINVQ